MSEDTPPRIAPFNPLDKKNLGESVAGAMLHQPVGNLPPEAFIGAGIYAIYYIGDFGVYRQVSELNVDDRFSWPIYIGKAVPAGARKGGFGLGADPKQVLFRRLVEHSTSIEQAENLNLDDFKCRFLVVDDIWIPLAESLLIETYHPLWNRKIDGFGNHDPGKGRHNQQRSPWDTLHPGRPWAERLRPSANDVNKIEEEAGVYLTTTRRRIDAQQGAEGNV